MSLNSCENHCMCYLSCSFPPNSCINCCACCLFCSFPPTTTREEFNSLPQNLRDEIIIEYIRTQAINSPCLWLESGICLHYEYRPRICRDFEIGGSGCQYLIKKAKEQF